MDDLGGDIRICPGADERDLIEHDLGHYGKRDFPVLIEAQKGYSTPLAHTVNTLLRGFRAPGAFQNFICADSLGDFEDSPDGIFLFKIDDIIRAHFSRHFQTMASAHHHHISGSQPAGNLHRTESDRPGPVDRDRTPRSNADQFDSVEGQDRKSTRLNSSHGYIPYAG